MWKTNGFKSPGLKRGDVSRTNTKFFSPTRVKPTTKMWKKRPKEEKFVEKNVIKIEKYKLKIGKIWESFPPNNQNRYLEDPKFTGHRLIYPR